MWTATGTASGQWLGNSVGTAGDVNGDGYDDIIVGRAGYQSVFVYYGSPTGLGTTPNWSVSGKSNGRAAGDVNGDGYDDVIMSGSGPVAVYYGSISGLGTTPVWTAEGQPNSYFGSAIGTAGDVNGDGYDDVIIGAQYYDGDQSDEGRAYVYYGSATGLSQSANWTAESHQTGSLFRRLRGDCRRRER